MASERKNNSNRKNAKLSTGPRTERGRHHSKSNALRHGLTIAVGRDPTFRSEIEMLTRLIKASSSQTVIEQLARQVAETEVDLLRIRKLKAACFDELYKIASPTVEHYAFLDERLMLIDRYEVRTLSRRKQSIRALIDAR